MVSFSADVAVIMSVISVETVPSLPVNNVIRVVSVMTVLSVRMIHRSAQVNVNRVIQRIVLILVSIRIVVIAIDSSQFQLYV